MEKLTASHPNHINLASVYPGGAPDLEVAEHFRVLESIWFIFFLIASIYELIYLSSNDLNFFIIAALTLLGLIISLACLIFKNFFSKQTAYILSIVLRTIIFLALIYLTGLLQSPFLIFLFFMPLISVLKSKPYLPVLVGFLITTALALQSIFLFEFRSLLYENPLKYILTVIGPLGIGSLISLLVNKNGRESANITRNFNITHKSSDNSELYEILYSIQDGVITTDLDGKINLISRKALEILNTSEAQVKTLPIAQVLPMLQTQTPKPSMDILIPSIDGENKQVSLRSYPLYNSQSQVKGSIYILTDKTREKELEQMRLDFVSMTAHQLRTPLTSMRSYLSLLTDSVAGKLTADEKLFLDRSTISTNQLLSLVENLLNVSRIEKNGLKIISRPIQLESLIIKAIENVIILANQKNIKVIFDQGNQPFPPVMGDLYLISEVITNLISNSINYTNQGGWVSITLQQQFGWVNVHVSDNGRGIPAEAIPHLFSKFYRVSKDLVQQSNGSGLGLFISKSIIEAHHGKIWVNSIEGKGSTFSFSLPQAG